MTTHSRSATLHLGAPCTPSDVQFIASTREHGVLQPITAIRTDDGVEVRDGQRRALAARQVGLATIPCPWYSNRYRAGASHE